ncbi:hypothetical protein TWF696_000215 [Orbilia brochopaga]|uniref:Methyltransferase domain-containing protein n=1 Tax=Orbilia brochopaga TaxID=3140254 RepID=A0AAV9VCY6_9PEZI
MQSQRLRICLLQASPHQDGALYSDVGCHTNQHTFEDRFIHKDSLHQDLNFAAAENFDLYINLLPWGWCRGLDIDATVLAVKHLKRLSIPLIGLPGRIVDKCTLDSSACLLLRDVANAGIKHDASLGDIYDCLVIVLENTPMALSPILRHSSTLLKRTDRKLYDNLRTTAENAFYANDLHGCFWCTVSILCTNDSELTTVGIRPMPQIFLPARDRSRGYSIEDSAIHGSFPGGHRSLIHCLVASYFLKVRRSSDVSRVIGQEYDGVAANYDLTTAGVYHDGIREIVTKYQYGGIVLDLACGTGLVARLNGEAQGLGAGDPENFSKFIGVDVSVSMRAECLRGGWYDDVIVGPIQRVLIAYVDPVDHIICIGALHYLDINELYLVLSRAFQLAKFSVTFTIDEIPESYNKALSRSGRAHMSGFNHLVAVDAYGIPVGWKLADRWRRLGWNSPTTGDEVYTNVFVFEHLQEVVPPCN